MNLMKNPMIATEAIDYQNDGYFKELTALMLNLKKDIGKEAIRAIELSVLKRFNMKIELTVTNELMENACMYPVSLDEVNPLDIRMGEGLILAFKNYTLKENKKHAKALASGKYGDPTGMLDYKHARVSGYFSEILLKAELTRPLVMRHEPEDIAAIFLHEIGHAWTYFEFMGVNIYRNSIIGNTIKESLNIKNEKEVFAFSVEMNNLWNIPIDPKTFPALNDENKTKIILGGMTRNMRSELGWVQYDRNTSEVIADQFSTRMGVEAGYFITRGLHRLSGGFRWPYWEDFAFLSNMAICAITVIVGITASAYTISIFGFIVAAFVLWATGGNIKEKNGSVYDDLYQRFVRIRNEMIGRLKQARATKEEIITTIKRLDQLENVLKTANTNQPILDKFYTWLSSDYRDQKNKMLYQQMVEDLLANDLYILGNKFKTL